MNLVMPSPDIWNMPCVFPSLITLNTFSSFRYFEAISRIVYFTPYSFLISVRISARRVNSLIPRTSFFKIPIASMSLPEISDTRRSPIFLIGNKS